MIARTTLLILGLVGIVFIAGCSLSPYVEDYHYAPHPAVAEIQAATTQPSQNAPPPLTAYATKPVGIRREDRDARIPLSVEVRIRLDSHGSQSVTFDPHTLDLTNGELVRFPPPLVTPQIISVLPDQPVMVQANFPFPPGLSYNNINLQTLQLRWAVQIDGHAVPQFADFRRVYRYYDEEPYYGVATVTYPLPLLRLPLLLDLASGSSSGDRAVRRSFLVSMAVTFLELLRHNSPVTATSLFDVLARDANSGTDGGDPAHLAALGGKNDRRVLGGFGSLAGLRARSGAGCREGSKDRVGIAPDHLAALQRMGRDCRGTLSASTLRRGRMVNGIDRLNDEIGKIEDASHRETRADSQGPPAGARRANRTGEGASG